MLSPQVMALLMKIRRRPIYASISRFVNSEENEVYSYRYIGAGQYLCTIATMVQGKYGDWWPRVTMQEIIEHDTLISCLTHATEQCDVVRPYSNEELYSRFL